MIDSVLTDLYLATGQITKAEPLLAGEAAKSGSRRLLLAQVRFLQKQPEKGRREAMMAAKQLLLYLHDHPEDYAARGLYGEACRLAGKPAQAESVLRDGMTLDPNGPGAEGLARFYLTWTEDLTRHPGPANRAQSQRLLQEAVAILESRGAAQTEVSVAGLYALAGQLYLKLGQPQRAQKVFCRAPLVSEQIWQAFLSRVSIKPRERPSWPAERPNGQTSASASKCKPSPMMCARACDGRKRGAS